MACCREHMACCSTSSSTGIAGSYRSRAPVLPVRCSLRGSPSGRSANARHQPRQHAQPGIEPSVSYERAVVAKCLDSSQFSTPVVQPVEAPVQAGSRLEGPSSSSPAGSHRLATLTRILLTGNNNIMFRNALSNKRPPTAGPLGLLLFILTVLAASFAAIRAALVRKVKGCKNCRGFGIQRCRLCMGAGRVDWAGKLSHYDVCPLCMNKRFVVCKECGGHYHRHLFVHLRRRDGGNLDLNEVYATSSVDEPQVVAVVGAVASARND